MKYAFFILLTFQAGSLWAQITDLEWFYPENRLYRQLKVKTVTDSARMGPVGITEYDSLGRSLRYYRPGERESSTPCVYLTQGDTLFRLSYYHDSIRHFEKFVYSRSKKILLHVLCGQSSFSDNAVYVQATRFFYDEADRLTCQLLYRAYRYYQPVSERMIIPETDLTLTDVTYYTYKKQNNTLLVIRKEGMGPPDRRSTDSLTYDRHNRLIRSGSFVKKSEPGDLGDKNLSWIAEYQYQPGKLTKVRYRTACHEELSNGRCANLERSRVTKKEIVFQPNGLPAMEYVFYSPNEEKYMLHKYSYSYRE